MRDPAWYSRWFGEEYLALYAHRTDDEARRQARTVLGEWGEWRPGRLLDLACGSGRHTRAFAAHGIPAVGLDLSVPLLRRARLARKARKGASCRFLRADMRQHPFGDGAFGAVVSFFTSIGYFDSDEENGAVLREACRVLAPGGRFVLDTFNPATTIASLVGTEEKRVGGRKVCIRRWYDSSRRRIEKEIVLVDGGGEQRFLESVRAFDRGELLDLLRTAGFEPAGFRPENADGSLAPTAEGSARWMIFATKPRA